MTTTPPGPPAGPITRDQAAEIAAQAITGLKSGVTFTLISEATQETASGWVFFYGVADSAQSGHSGLMVPGIGPLIVERQDGRIAFLSTSVPASEAVLAYEEERAAGGSSSGPDR